MTTSGKSGAIVSMITTITGSHHRMATRVKVNTRVITTILSNMSEFILQFYLLLKLLKQKFNLILTVSSTIAKSHTLARGIKKKTAQWTVAARQMSSIAGQMVAPRKVGFPRKFQSWRRIWTWTRMRLCDLIACVATMINLESWNWTIMIWRGSRTRRLKIATIWSFWRCDTINWPK